MLRVADAYAHLCPRMFSIEMWGGATFDTSMRFLKEDPWERLANLRERIPNILFQMLLRGSNAVGYTTYPDNVVKAFIREAADAGIDLFRVFDSLNWIPNMEVAIETDPRLRRTLRSRHLLHRRYPRPRPPQVQPQVLRHHGRELVKRGANLIAIKDMAGLCKPYAAKLLVKTLREEVGIPIHFHTHDIGGAQAASVLQASEVGLDIGDGAIASMSGLTSQPSLNALVEALRFTDRETGVDPVALLQMSRTGKKSATCTPPSRPAYAPPPPRSTPSKCPAASTRTCSSKPRPSASKPAGTRSARPTPRSTSSSAISSRSPPPRRSSATWPSSSSPIT